MSLGSNAEEFVRTMLTMIEEPDRKAWFLFWLGQPLGELGGRCPRDCLRDELDRRRVYKLYFGYSGLQPGRAPWAAHAEAIRTPEGGWTSRAPVLTPAGYVWAIAQ